MRSRWWHRNVDSGASHGATLDGPMAASVCGRGGRPRQIKLTRGGSSALIIAPTAEDALGTAYWLARPGVGDDVPRLRRLLALCRIRQQRSLQLLVDACSLARAWADGDWFNLGHGAFAFRDVSQGETLLDRLFGVSFRFRKFPCTIGAAAHWGRGPAAWLAESHHKGGIESALFGLTRFRGNDQAVLTFHRNSRENGNIVVEIVSNPSGFLILTSLDSGFRRNDEQ